MKTTLLFVLLLALAMARHHKKQVVHVMPAPRAVPVVPMDPARVVSASTVNQVDYQLASPVGEQHVHHSALAPLVTERVMHHPALMHHLPVATHYDHPIIPAVMPMAVNPHLQRPIIVDDAGQMIPNPSTSAMPLPNTLEAHNYYQTTPMPSAYEPVPQQYVAARLKKHHSKKH